MCLCAIVIVGFLCSKSSYAHSCGIFLPFCPTVHPTIPPKNTLAEEHAIILVQKKKVLSLKVNFGKFLKIQQLWDYRYYRQSLHNTIQAHAPMIISLFGSCANTTHSRERELFSTHAKYIFSKSGCKKQVHSSPTNRSGASSNIPRILIQTGLKFKQVLTNDPYTCNYLRNSR